MGVVAAPSILPCLLPDRGVTLATKGADGAREEAASASLVLLRGETADWATAACLPATFGVRGGALRFGAAAS